MGLREPSDLTNISFDEFVSLIFVRDMPPEAGRLDAFFDVGVEFDAPKMCAYYVPLARLSSPQRTEVTSSARPLTPTSVFSPSALAAVLFRKAPAHLYTAPSLN